MQRSPVDRPCSLPVAGSAPLPVPTQRQAFEQIQRASVSPRSPARLRHHSKSGSPRSRRSSESSGNIDIGSLTPPNMTFAIGTPPGGAGFFSRGNLTLSINVGLSNWIFIYTSVCSAASSGRQRSNTDGSLRQTSFAPNSLPSDAPRRHSVMMTSSQSFSDRQQLAARAGSGARLSDLIRRPSFAQDTPSDQSNKENMPSCGNADLSSPTTLAYAQSPPNMDGPVVFTVPELKSETLMGAEHRETLRRLQFVCTLVGCLSELAQTRSSPLLQSPRSNNKLTGCVVFVSEKQRRIEQLVIYIRALHILSTSLQLAKDEVGASHLQPTQAVKDGKHSSYWY